MQTSLPFIDIIIFAVIAIFLIFRLKNILGAKTGFDPTNDEKQKFKSETETNNIVKFTKKKEEEIIEFKNEIATLISLDRNFSVDKFISGANVFFNMVISSFVKGDLTNVNDYIKPTISKEFKKAISERVKEKEELIIDIKKIINTNLKDIKINKSVVKIKVLFESYQIKALRDKDDSLIDGDLSKEILVKDLWTFERNFSSKNVNWTLIETNTA